MAGSLKIKFWDMMLYKWVCSSQHFKAS